MAALDASGQVGSIGVSLHFFFPSFQRRVRGEHPVSGLVMSSMPAVSSPQVADANRGDEAKWQPSARCEPR